MAVLSIVGMIVGGYLGGLAILLAFMWGAGGRDEVTRVEAPTPVQSTLKPLRSLLREPLPEARPRPMPRRQPRLPRHALGFSHLPPVAVEDEAMFELVDA